MTWVVCCDVLCAVVCCGLLALLCAVVGSVLTSRQPSLFLCCTQLGMLRQLRGCIGWWPRWCHPFGQSGQSHIGACCSVRVAVCSVTPCPLQPLVVSGGRRGGLCCLVMQPGIANTLHYRVCCEAQGRGAAWVCGCQCFAQRGYHDGQSGKLRRLLSGAFLHA